MTYDEINAEVERQLNELRPARYHESDTEWMQPVIRWVEEQCRRDESLPLRLAGGQLEEETTEWLEVLELRRRKAGVARLDELAALTGGEHPPPTEEGLELVRLFGCD